MQNTQATTSQSEVKIPNETKPVVQPPAGVSDRMWQKFQSLQKRRLEVTKRSTEKRIKRLQDEVLQKVHEEFVQESDIDILRQHDIELPGITASKKCKLDTNVEKRVPSLPNETSTPSDTCSTSSKSGKDWSEYKSFLTCNDHLKGLNRGKYAAKTKLEEEVDKCIKNNDISKAEELSDQLSNREFGKKIADAIDAERYASTKKEDDEKRRKKSQKKLHWGFEQKHKWETKSNM